MKSSLQLNFSHQITLTPQLQQAIRLLQLSTLDLQQEIQQKLESNPMLEITGEDAEILEEESYTEENSEEFDWSDVYLNSTRSNLFNESDYVYDTMHCTTTTLQDHLRWQLDLTPISDIDKAIALIIIDAINDDGFLTISLEELHESLAAYQVEKEELLAVLHRIQQFDPIGCGAQNLTETLTIQLRALALNTPFRVLAEDILIHHLDLLAHHNYRQLFKIYAIDEQTLEHIIDLIQHLNPQPGSVLSNQKTEYVIPDLTMKKIANRWVVFLNTNALPHLGINSQYASLVKKVRSESDQQFLKNTLQEARWFLKSIQSRQETLLKVASYIADYQADFFEHGEEALKPLILNDVAFALSMHESTISRVTTQKYIYTPRGLFELKYFFSSHLSTAEGGECSSKAIQALIKKFISSEDRKKPLSDSKIMKLIASKGIKIARRTVSKYRELLGIAASNERKSI